MSTECNARVKGKQLQATNAMVLSIPLNDITVAQPE